MTFERKPLSIETLRLGIREQIKQEVKNKDFYHYRKNDDHTDIELFRYVCHEGKKEWFEWLLANSDFYNSRGNIKEEFRGTFDESLGFAVRGNHLDIARKLFGMGSKVRYYMNDDLFMAIRKGQYEMAELLFEHGARIYTKNRLKEILAIADDRMVEIIMEHRESLRLSLIADKQKCIDELLEKRKKRKVKKV